MVHMDILNRGVIYKTRLAKFVFLCCLFKGYVDAIVRSALKLTIDILYLISYIYFISIIGEPFRA